jgi:hypothetical protein
MGNTSKTYGLATNVLATRDVIDKLMNDNVDDIAAYRRIYKYTRVETPSVGTEGILKISNVYIFPGSDIVTDTTALVLTIRNTFDIANIRVNGTDITSITKTGNNPEIGKPAVWTVTGDFDRFKIMFTIELIGPFSSATQDDVWIQYGLKELYP